MNLLTLCIPPELSYNGNMEKKSLLGKSLEELQSLVADRGLPRFRAAQIADWIYKKKITDIDEMTNLSQKDRELLKEEWQIGRSEPVHRVESSDGTVKYLYSLGEEGQSVEAVFIPDRDRATLCISSQWGCKMACRFCMTGRMGFLGQLTAAQILNQIFSLPEMERLTNVVYMGMGEPLDNLDAVLASLNVLTEDWGLGWSPKRITLSTIGVLPQLERFLQESKVHLALSLHDPFDTERKELMPMEKTWPVEKVVELISRYDFSGQRRFSLEYIMFDGINDSLRHARQILKLMKGQRCRINLIRFHSIPDSSLKGSPEAQMVEFRDYLNQKGMICTIRSSRGEDILAACGMLSTQTRI